MIHHIPPGLTGLALQVGVCAVGGVDMSPGVGPLNSLEIGVNDHDLIGRDELLDLQEHTLRVFATRVRNVEDSSSISELLDLGCHVVLK